MRQPYLKKMRTIGASAVCMVDGNYVRSHLNREFCNFGQHCNFSFIPKNELWVEKESAPGEALFY